MMNEEIKASPYELMQQATLTAYNYYCSLEELLDKKYGKGWSKENCETIARLAVSASIDFHTALLAKKLQDLTGSFDDFVRSQLP